VRQRPIEPRSRPRSRGHRRRAGVEALEPAHEERGNGETATIGGADGGGKKIEEVLTGGRYGEFGLRLGASCVGRFELRLGKKVTRHERAGATLRLAVGVVLVLVAVDDRERERGRGVRASAGEEDKDGRRR
jgi:hypothetical protein